MSEDDDPPLTVAEAAERLRLSVPMVYLLCKDKQLVQMRLRTRRAKSGVGLPHLFGGRAKPNLTPTKCVGGPDNSPPG